jgi:ATP-dependent Clp protease adapter protein ClpS
MKRDGIILALSACMLCGCGTKSAADSTQTEQASVNTDKTACKTVNYYDYSKPVPASAKIDDSYFMDTFFGGDSRMGSLVLYSDLNDKGADIYYAESLRLWAIEKTDVETTEGTDTMYNLMMNTTRKNVYLLLGINEIRSDDFVSWGEYYDEVIQTLLEKKPDANVYLMMAYYPQELADIDNNTLKQKVDDENSYLVKIAEKYHVYLLDIDKSMKDENGKVRADLVWDGLHLNQTGGQAYADYIATHVVRKDDYVKEICE